MFAKLACFDYITKAILRPVVVFCYGSVHYGSMGFWRTFSWSIRGRRFRSGSGWEPLEKHFKIMWGAPAAPLCKAIAGAMKNDRPQNELKKPAVFALLILRFGSASVNNLCKTGENQRVFNTFVRKVLIYLAFSRLCQSVRQRADPKSRYWPHFLGRVGAAGWINWRVLRAIVFYQKHSENLEFSSLLQENK